MLPTRLILPAVRRLLTSRTSCRAALVLLLSAVPCGWPDAAQPSDIPAARKPHDRYDDLIMEAAERFDIPAAWIHAVIGTERDGDSDPASANGAMGPMQIMPEAWARLRIHYGLGDDPYDPHDNIMAGAAHLRELFDRFGNPGFLAAHNMESSRDAPARTERPLPPRVPAHVAQPALDLTRDETRRDAPKRATPPTVEAPFWARAPIFTPQPIRTPAAEPASSDRAPPTPDVRDVTAIVPWSAGLFIARGSPGEAQ